MSADIEGGNSLPPLQHTPKMEPLIMNGSSGSSEGKERFDSVPANNQLNQARSPSQPPYTPAQAHTWNQPQPAQPRRLSVHTSSPMLPPGRSPQPLSRSPLPPAQPQVQNMDMQGGGMEQRLYEQNENQGGNVEVGDHQAGGGAQPDTERMDLGQPAVTNEGSGGQTDRKHETQTPSGHAKTTVKVESLSAYPQRMGGPAFIIKVTVNDRVYQGKLFPLQLSDYSDGGSGGLCDGSATDATLSAVDRSIRFLKATEEATTAHRSLFHLVRARQLDRLQRGVEETILPDQEQEVVEPPKEYGPAGPPDTIPLEEEAAPIPPIPEGGVPPPPQEPLQGGRSKVSEQFGNAMGPVADALMQKVYTARQMVDAAINGKLPPGQGLAALRQLSAYQEKYFGMLAQRIQQPVQHPPAEMPMIPDVNSSELQEGGDDSASRYLRLYGMESCMVMLRGLVPMDLPPNKRRRLGAVLRGSNDPVSDANAETGETQEGGVEGVGMEQGTGVTGVAEVEGGANGERGGVRPRVLQAGKRGGDLYSYVLARDRRVDPVEVPQCKRCGTWKATQWKQSKEGLLCEACVIMTYNNKMYGVTEKKEKLRVYVMEHRRDIEEREAKLRAMIRARGGWADQSPIEPAGPIPGRPLSGPARGIPKPDSMAIDPLDRMEPPLGPHEAGAAPLRHVPSVPRGYRRDGTPPIDALPGGGIPRPLPLRKPRPYPVPRSPPMGRAPFSRGPRVIPGGVERDVRLVDDRMMEQERDMLDSMNPPPPVAHRPRPKAPPPEDDWGPSLEWNREDTQSYRSPSLSAVGPARGYPRDPRDHEEPWPAERGLDRRGDWAADRADEPFDMPLRDVRGAPWPASRERYDESRALGGGGWRENDVPLLNRPDDPAMEGRVRARGPVAVEPDTYGVLQRRLSSTSMEPRDIGIADPLLDDPRLDPRAGYRPRLSVPSPSMAPPGRLTPSGGQWGAGERKSSAVSVHSGGSGGGVGLEYGIGEGQQGARERERERERERDPYALGPRQSGGYGGAKGWH